MAEKKRALDPKAAGKREWTEERAAADAERLALQGVSDPSKRYLLEPLERAEAHYAKAERKAAGAAPFGWDAFNQATLYAAHDKRIGRGVKVDMEAYEAAKAADPEFYRDGNSMLYGHAPAVPAAAVDRMADELKAQAERAKQFSRRRKHYDERDVDAINDRNQHFNRKLERSYGTYTAEIKANLERGTALPEH